MHRRRARTARVLSWVALSLSLLLFAGAAVGTAVYSHLNTNLRSKDITSRLGPDRPVVAPTRAVTLLIAGSDSRKGLGDTYGAGGPLEAHSDTLLIVHVSADRTWASVVSVPRDSYVPIPSCLDSTGKASKPISGSKINYAFTLGSRPTGDLADGAACTIKTVEADTGVRIDHFMVVDFTGFRAVVDALGGVPICAPQAIKDPMANVNLPAGRSVLSGATALGYVRARYSLGDGSDLGRIQRQQQFAKSLLATARSRLTDPVRTYRFLDAGTKTLVLDRPLGDLRALADLAQSFRAVPMQDVTFVTVPNRPRSEVVPTDQANVIWRMPQARELFNDLARDRRPKTDAQKRRGVTLRIQDATGTSGGAARTAAQLARLGFTVLPGTKAVTPLESTRILTGPAGQASALLAQAVLPGSSVEPAAGNPPGGQVTVVVGRRTITPTPTPTGTPAPKACA